MTRFGDSRCSLEGCISILITYIFQSQIQLQDTLIDYSQLHLRLATLPRPFVYPVCRWSSGYSTAAYCNFSKHLVSKHSFSVLLRNLLSPSTAPSWIHACPWGLGVAVGFVGDNDSHRGRGLHRFVYSSMRLHANFLASS